ncbi:MAG TPA: hypothetical protein PKD59_10425 [Miltoncostaeaceae bacterium]|nr:hypothetical protein [Miltoncostaeaceae bacterium]
MSERWYPSAGTPPYLGLPLVHAAEREAQALVRRLAHSRPSPVSPPPVRPPRPAAPFSGERG